MPRSLIDPEQAAERLPDEHDLAARLAEAALTSALNVQARRAATGPASTPGVCMNCGEACLPRAVYCDADCRQDHEARLSTRARQGGGGTHAA